jgi:hypothetical protein
VVFEPVSGGAAYTRRVGVGGGGGVVWPDDGAVFEFPGSGERFRWQTAIDEGLAAGGLVLRCDYGDVFVLEGLCPRCGHRMSQVVEFEVIVTRFRPGGGRGGGSASVEVVCSCGEGHSSRPAGERGCGWGRGLVVTVVRPRR